MSSNDDPLHPQLRSRGVASRSGGAEGHAVTWQSALPVEVIERSDVLRRSSGPQMRRPMFHQLVVCWSGSGIHEVDFETLPMGRGTVLRIHPGQAQRFMHDSRFDASMVIWPEESLSKHRTATTWFPGSEEPTRWLLDDAGLERLLLGIEDIRRVQEERADSALRDRLMTTLLEALLLTLDLEVDTGPTKVRVGSLPAPYLDFRRLLEDRLHRRMSVRGLAAELGYSVRTLDRACVSATGSTAKALLDERTVLEIRRWLVRTAYPVSKVGADLGFSSPSSFTSYVKRHLGESPGEIRRRAQAVSE